MQIPADLAALLNSNTWSSFPHNRKLRRASLGKRCRRGGNMIEPLERRRLFSVITVNASGGAEYTDLGNAIDAAKNGDTILVSPGNYVAHPTVLDPSASTYYIPISLTIQSTGGAGNTTLTVPSGQEQAIWITTSNVTINGFTVNGGYFGIQASSQNSSTLSNVVLRNLIVHPDASTTNGHGIYLYNVANSAVENDYVGLSSNNGIYLYGGCTNDLVMNNTVNGTVYQHAIALQDSNYNQVLDNTVTSSANDGIILVGSSYNRITNNNISGHKYDGITLTRDAGGSTIYYSDFNYIAENTIVSLGYQNGLTAGTGIWLDSESDGNTVYANTASGSPECGIADYLSSNNFIQANTCFNNHEGGILVWNVPSPTSSVGNPPNDIVIEGNYIYDTPSNAAIILRGANNTQVSNNVMIGNYTGVAGSSYDGGMMLEAAGNATIWQNTFMNVSQSFSIDGNSTNINIFQNRSINFGENYCFQPATVNWDAGVNLGGNYWSGFAAVGNPSTTTPYTHFVYDDIGDLGGGFIDNHPYQSESLGQPYTATITSPIAGSTLAAGSTQTIAWQSTASVYVDLSYYSSETGTVAIATNVPNTGFYRWKLPSTLPAGSDYVIQITPEDSTKTAQSSAINSNVFSVSPVDLNLLTPGNDARGANAGTMLVAWQDAVANTPVNVQMQLNGGTWQTLATNITTDYTTVTLPNSGTNQARMRIVDASTGYISTQDGYFNLRQSAGVTSNTGGNPVRIGSNQLLTWTSPAGSQTVKLELWNGTAWQTIVNGLPDNGQYSWFVPDQPVANQGAEIRITYYDLNGSQLVSDISSMFSIQYTISVATPAFSNLSTSSSIAQGTASVAFSGNIAAGTSIPSSSEAVAITLNGVIQDAPINAQGNFTIAFNTSSLPASNTPYQVTYAYAGDASFNSISDNTTTTLLVMATNGTETAVYRLYSQVTKEHLYTADLNEYNTLGTRGWDQEGLAYDDYTGLITIGGVTTEPLYRLYNIPTQQHLWTTDANEYNTLKNFVGTWSVDGISGYIFPANGNTSTSLAAVPGSAALYRMSWPFNPAADLHLWTTDLNEYDTDAATYGWTKEGVIGYVV